MRATPEQFLFQGVLRKIRKMQSDSNNGAMLARRMVEANVNIPWKAEASGSALMRDQSPLSDTALSPMVAVTGSKPAARHKSSRLLGEK